MLTSKANCCIYGCGIMCSLAWPRTNYGAKDEAHAIAGVEEAKHRLPPLDRDSVCQVGLAYGEAVLKQTYTYMGGG